MPKMKTYRDFAAWLDDRTEAERRLIALLREIVANAAPSLSTSSKWGNGVWLKGELPLLYIRAADSHIEFGFFAGAALDDPGGRLRGAGKFVRHVRIYSEADIDREAFSRLIRQAVDAPPYR